MPVADCTIVDAVGRRVVEAGDFELLVGSSARDADLLHAPFTGATSLTHREEGSARLTPGRA